MSLNYLSVCSGIEAASAAWAPLGWHPVAFSEIEKFPSQVLSHHFGSNMPGEALSGNAPPNLGDMNKFREWPDYANLDVLVGGTPCQSFSVAGLRKGLADPRGNLALVYLGIADRYRPEWLLWENVPGVLSSDEGRDFGAFLGGMVELGYSFAYRVLDAQYIRIDGFGRAVPQRRRRVFVVGHSDWRRAAAVLFDPASLRGDSPPGRQSGQGVAPTIAARTRGGGGLGTDFDCDGGLITSTGSVSHCLNAGAPGVGIGEPGDPSPTIASSHTPAVAIQAGALRENPNSGPDGAGVQEGLAYTLEARAEVQAVANGWAVRRLMPIECERLQGFPDGYTDIPMPNGKPAADGPRYKALGNSMAVNVIRWIGRRIEMVNEIASPPSSPPQAEATVMTSISENHQGGGEPNEP